MKRSIVFVLAAVLLVGCSAGPDASRPGASPDGSARAGTFTRIAALTGEPCGFEVSERDLWILSCAGTLIRVPKDGGESRAEHLGGEVLSLDGLVAGDAARLWALVSERTSRARAAKLVGIDTGSGALSPVVDAGASVPMGAASADGRLWAGMLDGRLLDVREERARLVARGQPLVWVVAEGGSPLWTISEDGSATMRDPLTGEGRATFDAVVPDPIAAASAFGRLWVSTPSKVVALDTAGEARNIDVNGPVNSFEPCAGSLWLSQADVGVRSVNGDGSVATSVPLEVAPRYLACDGSTLWVLTEDGRVGSIDTGS